MAEAAYPLGALTSLLCAVLLLRGYLKGRSKLLLWSGLCFSGLAISNFGIFVDLVLLPQIDLFPYRLAVTAISFSLLLYGLIWESK